MSTTTFSVLSIPTPAMPRGATAAVAVYRLVARLFGQRRQSESDLAAQEAAAVRQLADRMRATDPGFAADLYAAADRHQTRF